MFDDTMETLASINSSEQEPLISRDQRSDNDNGENAEVIGQQQNSRPPRLVSLDVFRGLTVALMILVDDVGGIIPVLNHSPWNGMTIADFVMPFFLFIVGVSLALVYKKINDKMFASRKAILRTFKLLVLGIVLQGGYFHGVNHLTYGVNIEKIRIPGILQRIAFGYFITAISEIWLPHNGIVELPYQLLKKYYMQWLVAFLLSAVYLGLLYGLYVPSWTFSVMSASSFNISSIQSYNVTCGVRGNLEPPCNAVGMIDRYIFGIQHLYQHPGYQRLKVCKITNPPSWCQAPFDPEGLLRRKKENISQRMGSRVLFRLALQTGKVNHSSLQHVNYQALLNSTQCGLRGRHRHMSVLNEFSKRIKGELESNPELQKSIKELKEKAEGFKEITEDLKTRTKQTTKNLYEQADAVRAEAELKAKQVSTAMKEKISAASEQAKGFTENFKIKPHDTSAQDNTAEGAADGKVSSNGYASQETEKIENMDSDSQNVKGADKAFFSKFGSGIASAASSTLNSLKGSKVLEITKKGYDLVKEELTTTSSRRQRIKTQAAASSYKERSSRTDIVHVAENESRFSKKWEELKEKARSHPVYKRVCGISEHPVVTKGQELAEDLRERWETSDSPVVHKIQDLNDTIFGESATAISYKEIRRRDPLFSLPDFIEDVQQMIRPTLQAYFKGDLELLKKHCCFEVIDRCKAERRAYESQGIFFDNKILHISEVEVKETKLLGNAPIIIVTFQTQQIYCVKDRNGKVTQGGEDDIHTVYYAWAMQQTDTEEMGEGEFYPTWKLREMQQLGVKSLI